MKNSSRGSVDPFIVMDVMEAARQLEDCGRNIIHMEVGQPSTSAPKAALDVLRRTMSVDPIGYTVALGLPELRRKIAELYYEWYGVSLNPDRVVVTSGSSAAFLLSFTSLFDSGDKVGIGAPGYPSYRQILKSLGICPVDIETAAENGYQPVSNDLKGHDLAGLLVASPANPTGTMLSKKALSDLLATCQSMNIAFISDEIYHGIEYEKKAVTALEISDECYVINSFSKYFSMTGWRVGWMVVPEDHVRRIERVAQNMFICAPHASQIVALAALECSKELDANLDVYRLNRAIMIEGLHAAGFDTITPPDGAFYIYADVGSVTDDSLAFARDILNEAWVAVTPGLDFDPVRGVKTLRFSYARSTKEIREGLERLQKFMRGRGHIS